MEHFHQVLDIPGHAIPTGRLRLLSGAQLMVFWAEMDANTHVDKHSHPNEQITWLIEGVMDFKIGDAASRRCESGSIVLVPAGQPHEVWYRERCIIAEVFNPPRFDVFPDATQHPYGMAPA